jgi:hypothetical protein
LQGACTEDPSTDLLAKVTGAKLLELNPKQCLILSPAGVLPLTEGKSWVDNLYFRFAKSTLGETASSGGPAAPLHVHSGEAFISNVIIQGDGNYDMSAFFVFPSANVLMMGAMPAVKFMVSLSAVLCCTCK